jgi:hypothetical protein
MGIQSGGYHPTLNEPKRLKYWAQLAAIRRIMRDASDPATVLDALFEPMSPTQTASDGKRIYPSRGMGGTSKKPPTTPKEVEQQLQTELLELESTDADVRAAAARYDQMAGWTPPKGTG